MTTTAATAPEGFRDPELGLRDLVRRDYLVAAHFGAFLAILLYVAGGSFSDESLIVPLTVLGFGLGFLGYLDKVTRLIRNRHNLLFGAAAAVSLIFPAVVHDKDVLLPAVLGAAGAFTVLIVLTLLTGFAGGGDIKLAPIPGAVLTVISPMTAVAWLWFSLLFCMIGFLHLKMTGSKDKTLPMAPFMAAAAVPAVMAGGLLQMAMVGI